MPYGDIPKKHSPFDESIKRYGVYDEVPHGPKESQFQDEETLPEVKKPEADAPIWQTGGPTDGGGEASPPNYEPQEYSPDKPGEIDPDTGLPAFGAATEMYGMPGTSPYATGIENIFEHPENYETSAPGMAALEKAEKAGMATLESDIAKQNQALAEQAHMAGIGATGAYAQGMEGITTQGALAKGQFGADIAEKKAAAQLGWINSQLAVLGEQLKTATDNATKIAIQDKINGLEQQKINIEGTAQEFEKQQAFSDTAEAMLSTFIEEGMQDAQGYQKNGVAKAYNSAQAAVWALLSTGDLTYAEAMGILNDVLGYFGNAIYGAPGGWGSNPTILWLTYKSEHPEILGALTPEEQQALKDAQS